jgi:hypothetical protein
MIYFTILNFYQVVVLKTADRKTHVQSFVRVNSFLQI